MPIILIIDEKITLEQLMQGKKVEIFYETQFNRKTQRRIFPDDFSLEEQAYFKQVYDNAVYSSELGMKSYKVGSVDKTITLEIKERFGINENDIQIVDNTHLVKIRFTRYGYETTTITLDVPYGEAFSEQQNSQLLAIGIIVTGTSNNFTITQQRGDISVEFIKGENDSFIDFPEFTNGKIIFQKYNVPLVTEEQFNNETNQEQQLM